MATKKVVEKKTFEQALQELATIIANLEKGELSLSEALTEYEKGITLTAFCNNALSVAKLKVEELKLNEQDQ